MRAVDQGREVRTLLDKALLQSLPLQPGPPRPVRAGIQSRQLPPPLRPSKRDFLLVAPKRPAEAHKDRGKGGEPLQEDHFPVRRGGDLSSAVRCPAERIRSPETVPT